MTKWRPRSESQRDRSASEIPSEVAMLPRVYLVRHGETA